MEKGEKEKRRKGEKEKRRKGEKEKQGDVRQFRLVDKAKVGDGHVGLLVKLDVSEGRLVH